MTNKILFLIGENFEDLEFFYPYYRLIEEGYQPIVAYRERRKVTGKHGYAIEPNITFKEVNPEEYIALVIPGGKGPADIRNDEDVKRIVNYFMSKSKPVAAICHGPQVLVSANVVKGRKLTSWPAVSNEVKEAGGEWHDMTVVVDGNLVTSRMPSDLPNFASKVISLLKQKVQIIQA
jgi:intracellular protease, PfpI family